MRKCFKIIIIHLKILMINATTTSKMRLAIPISKLILIFPMSIWIINKFRSRLLIEIRQILKSLKDNILIILNPITWLLIITIITILHMYLMILI